MLRTLVALVSLVLPWSVRRWVLEHTFGYRIHPTSWIGFSWVFPRKLELEEHALIRHLTVCRGLDRLHVGPYARIGNANWILGYPSDAPTPPFDEQPDRVPELVLDEHASITTRHYIDCTDSVTLGRFSLIAGVRSVLFTHSIDLDRGKQACAPIQLGAYCQVGTNSVLLPGSSLPDFSALGANSLLNKRFDVPYRLYAGSPARETGELRTDAEWFLRTTTSMDWGDRFQTVGRALPSD